MRRRCLCRPFLCVAVVALAGCGTRPEPVPTGAVAPPAEIVLPQEVVPPGVKPLSREVEEMGSQ